MCGICGVFNFSGQAPEKEIVSQMNQKMLHRGPDDEGVYFSGPAALGMRRLSIIDTYGGHQPIANEDNTIWVVLNGEIYNYIELREELEQKGHKFRTSSDTEVLVHLYEEEGVAGIDKLNGMFAFALYDQSKQAMWIARDRLGIKPLFYSHQKNEFLFSSDLTSLNAAVQTREINQNAFMSYLAFAYGAADQSMFSGIHKLLPGHWLWIDEKGVKSHQYWDVTQFQTWQGSIADAEEQLHDLLDHSIQLQLRSDVPVGISLSGGVDSSAIAAYAGRHRDELTTFTIDFVGKKSQDTVYAREMAGKLGTKHVEIPFSSAEIPQYLNELMPFIDEPISDSAMMSSYLVAKYANQSGIKVLLNGAGGDEIFGGYHRHHPPVTGSTAWFAEQVPSPLLKLISPLVRMVNKDKSLRMQDQRIAFGAGYSAANLAAFSELFKQQNQYQQLRSNFTGQLDNVVSRQQGNSYSYSRMYTDLKHYLVGDILALSDKSMMACSVEGRVPLLDHRLVEFAFSLPDSINILRNQPKGLFRQILTTHLPQELLSRKKEGFSAPMATWAGGSFGHDLKQELLVDTIPFYKDMFSMKALTKWVNVVHNGRGHIAADTIFRLYLFSRWYRYHIGRG